MSEMRCPKCGILIEDTDNFCRHCGRGLKPGQGFLHSHTGIILMMLILGIAGSLHCILFGSRLRKYHYSDS